MLSNVKTTEMMLKGGLLYFNGSSVMLKNVKTT